MRNILLRISTFRLSFQPAFTTAASPVASTMSNETRTFYLLPGESETDQSNISLFYEDTKNISESGTNLYQVPYSAIVLLSVLYGTISIAALVGNVIVLGIIYVSIRYITTSRFLYKIYSKKRV